MLVKIFVFDEETKREKVGLDKNIVRFTNSQNGINDKAFASKHNYFLNIQKEFRSRGFLLLVKPSDKYKFQNEFADKTRFAELRQKANFYMTRMDIQTENLADYMIPLEKFLKVLLAFHVNGYTAFVRGSSVLKPNSPLYKDFSLNIEEVLTIDNMLNLYLLYAKTETEKMAGDKRYPIPYYVLSFIGNAFRNKDYKETNRRLDAIFKDSESIMPIYDFYKILTATYAEEYRDSHDVDYNVMIKQEIDEPALQKCLNSALKFYPQSAYIEDFIGQ